MNKQVQIKQELQRLRNNGREHIKSFEIAQNIDLTSHIIGRHLSDLEDEGVVSKWNDGDQEITWCIELDRCVDDTSDSSGSYTRDTPRWTDEFEAVSNGEPEAWIRRQYLNEKASKESIASMANTSSYWVNQALDALEIDSRPGPDEAPQHWRGHGTEGMEYVGTSESIDEEAEVIDLDWGEQHDTGTKQ